jgi:hypothetical protein
MGHQETTSQCVFAERLDKEVVGTCLEKKSHVVGSAAHDGHDDCILAGSLASQLPACCGYGLVRDPAHDDDRRAFAVQQAHGFRCVRCAEGCLRYFGQRLHHRGGQSIGKRT